MFSLFKLHSRWILMKVITKLYFKLEPRLPRWQFLQPGNPIRLRRSLWSSQAPSPRPPPWGTFARSESSQSKSSWKVFSVKKCRKKFQIFYSISKEEDHNVNEQNVSNSKRIRNTEMGSTDFVKGPVFFFSRKMFSSTILFCCRRWKSKYR